MESSGIEIRQVNVKIDKMTIPLLQQISDDNDLSEIIRFFLIFSWFEYALKRAGYLKNMKVAEPDWDSFSDCINGDLRSQEIKNPTLGVAVKYLKECPPEKQTIEKEANGMKSLVLLVPKPTGNEARVLTTYIRRIRNNLFHGAKIPFDPTRDIKLIGSATTILTHFLELDAACRVRHCYKQGGYFWSANQLKS
jgi:hypothetical protein